MTGQQERWQGLQDLYVIGKYVAVFRECVVIHGLYLYVSVDDVDGDDVRCRWAESSKSECSGVCQVFENSQLSSVSTTTIGPINFS